MADCADAPPPPPHSALSGTDAIRILFVFGGRTAGGLCHSYVRSEARRDGDTRTRARATFGALVDNAEHAAPHGRLALAVHPHESVPHTAPPMDAPSQICIIRVEDMTPG